MYVHQALSSCARCPAIIVTLEAGGAGTYTQRAIPGTEPSQDSRGGDDPPLIAADVALAWLGKPREGQPVASQDDPVPSQGGSDRYRALCKAQEELLREFACDFEPNWQISLVRFNIPVRLNSTGFSWLYVGIDLAAFVFGIVCIFLGSSWRELGIALIVGAMFGMGTFVGQLLSVQLNNEQHRQDLLWRDRLVQKYAARLAEITEGIQTLDNESE